MAFTLRCPDCRGKFAWQPSAKMPRFCPLCSADMGEEVDDSVICIPAFISAKTKNTDKSYRDLERASEKRAETAAAMCGSSVADMSGLKITDLKDTKPGEIAAKEVVNPVSTFMQNTGIGGFQGSNGSEYGAAVKTGFAPNAGARTMAALQRIGKPG